MFLYDSPIGYHLYKTTPEVTLKSELLFSSSETACDCIKKLNDKKLPDELLNFLNDNSITEISVGDENLREILKLNYDVKIDVPSYRSIKNIFKMKNSSFLINTAHKLAVNNLELDLDRQDIMIIQSIKVIEDLEKDINMHSMKIREWYSLHFPEMDKEISENEKYLQAVKVLRIKENFKDFEGLKKILGDKTDEVLELKNVSMGIEMNEDDIQKIVNDCDLTLKMAEYRRKLLKYLREKVEFVMPNVNELLGEVVTARLLAKAGSLLELCQLPSSTIQILGAEKALFSALKSKANTPKYGIIFHAPLVLEADPKFKGKIARSLASKVALAAKVDQNQKTHSNIFGKEAKEKLKKKLNLLNPK